MNFLGDCPSVRSKPEARMVMHLLPCELQPGRGLPVIQSEVCRWKPRRCRWLLRGFRTASLVYVWLTNLTTANDRLVTRLCVYVHGGENLKAIFRTLLPVSPFKTTVTRRLLRPITLGLQLAHLESKLDLRVALTTERSSSAEPNLSLKLQHVKEVLYSLRNAKNLNIHWQRHLQP